MSQEFDERAKEWDRDRVKVERAETIAAKILSIIPGEKQIKALEFGCGTGLVGFNLLDHLSEITFADISSGMLEQVKKKIDEKGISNASILNLEKDEIKSTYDLIFTLLALHHVEDYKGILKTILSSVTDSGYVAICDLDKEDGSFHGEKVPHNGFERDEIKSIIEDNGFEIVFNDVVYMMHREENSSQKDFPIFMLAGIKR